MRSQKCMKHSVFKMLKGPCGWNSRCGGWYPGRRKWRGRDWPYHSGPVSLVKKCKHVSYTIITGLKSI